MKKIYKEDFKQICAVYELLKNLVENKLCDFCCPCCAFRSHDEWFEGCIFKDIDDALEIEKRKYEEYNESSKGTMGS